MKLEGRALQWQHGCTKQTMSHLPRLTRILCLSLFLLSACLPVTLFTFLKAHAASTITIDKTIAYQQIDGFGSFGPKNAWWSGGPFYDDPFLSFMVDDLGTTIIRDELTPDFSLSAGTYNLDTNPNDLCKAQNVPQRQHMAYLKDLKARATAHGEPLKVITTVWSPPFYMKTNNCVYGYDTNTNRLSTSQQTAFADYLIHYIQTLKQETGIDLYAISIQNEPSLALGYQSAFYTQELLRDTLKVVGQRFDAQGITTKIFYPEEISNAASVSKYIELAMNDTQAQSSTDILAVHGYSSNGVTSASSQQFWDQIGKLAAKYNRPLWMTETSGYNQDWNGGLQLAGAIYTALKYGKVSGWVWWMSSDSSSTNQALLLNGNHTPLSYASKQFYRYIRPGAVQVESNSPDSDVLVTAFKHDQQKTTSIVLINQSSSAKDVQLSFTGSNIPDQFTLYRSSASEGAANVGTVNKGSVITLPAQSVTTLYGSSTSGDPLSAPVIKTQPQSLTVSPGSSTELNVKVGGTPPFTYQWKRNGNNITGAKGSRYAFIPTSFDNGAKYSVTVSNAQGQVTSSEATLTIGTFTGVTAKQATGSVNIDGNPNDSVWSNAQSYSLNQVIDNPQGLSATFQTAWDTNNLYVLVKVIDPQYASGQDIIEIYTDGHNDKISYYDDNDWQWLIAQKTNGINGYRGAVPTTPISAPSASQTTTSNGYIQEVAIPWSNLNVSATNGALVGFDIDIDQRNASNARLGKLFYHDTGDNAWYNPSVLSVLQLGNGSVTPTPTPTPTPTSTPTPTPTPTPGNGTGLKGDYYNSQDLSGAVALTRTDAQVNFDWGTGSPGSGIAVDHFSARWTGQVQAPVSGNYTFSTTSDDGIRLWVNGNLIINNWTDHAPTTDTSSSLNLTAGQKYDLKLEFYENGGGATAKLLWTPPGGSQQTLPQSQLFPATGTLPPSSDLAQGKPTTTSGGSLCAASEASANAVDGDTASKWCQNGNGNGPYTLQVDLGATHSLTGFRIRHAGSGGEDTAFNTSDYQIQVSTNGTSWTTVVTVTANTSDVTDHTITSTQGRYVRLLITKAQSNPSYQAARIYQFTVSGS